MEPEGVGFEPTAQPIEPPQDIQTQAAPPTGGADAREISTDVPPEAAQAALGNVIAQVNQGAGVNAPAASPGVTAAGGVSGSSAAADAALAHVVAQVAQDRPATPPVFQPFTPEGPANTRGPNPATPAAADPNFGDRAANGNAYHVAAPNVNANQDNPYIFVNGVNTDLAGARATAQELSRLTNSPVDMVYNNSSSQVALNLAARQFGYDPNSTWDMVRGIRREDVTDWAKANALHNPPASQTETNLIMNRLDQGKPVNIIAYSQGAAITTDALRQVDQQLVAKYGREKASEMMGNIRVLTIGGAAERDEFPAGVQVSSFAHRNDGIAMAFGENDANFGILQLGNLTDFTQHTNYFRGQGGGNTPGDPNAERMLERWRAGENFPFQLLNDVPARRR